jgi:hypothetical protein
MTVIEMDIDGAKACSSTLRALVDEMEAIWPALLKREETLEDVWRSDSETEFRQGFEALKPEYFTKIEGLRRCIGRLDAAIAAAWEAQMGLSGY